MPTTEKFNIFDNTFAVSVDSKSDRNGDRFADILVQGDLDTIKCAIALKIHRHPEIMDMLSDAVAIARELNNEIKDKN